MHAILTAQGVTTIKIPTSAISISGVVCGRTDGVRRDCFADPMAYLRYAAFLAHREVFSFPASLAEGTLCPCSMLRAKECTEEL